MSKIPWLEKFKIVLDDWLDSSELDNQFLANELGISERQFYRKVKKLTGKSPNIYIRQYRMQKAMELIHSGQYFTMQEVAIAVGYQSSYYFSQAFKKEHGEGPMQVFKKLGYR